MTSFPPITIPPHRKSIDLVDIAPKYASRFQNYCNIIYALIMHDIKNRFFGSGIGQIVMVFWPFVHILVILSISFFTHRPHAYGSSILQYSSVSIFPWICFNYVCRWIVFAAITNRSFLQYPIIRPLDLLVARALLEIVSMSLVGVLLVLLVLVCGGDVMPADPMQAFAGVGATILLAIGFALPNAAITFVLPIWNLFVILCILLTWVSSGAVFVASTLPEQLRTPLSYNPVLQCTEWLRVAYYNDYPTIILDRTYVLEFGLVSLTLGLVMVNLLRRYI